ncbi:uncharacterized protein LOC114247523 [Bombyx mandarina]|uniref:Uncharacterized protein LOC114247523 n=1 Tax=Bombyx mandarina TaxID=7092 RepID=A0A6J2K7Q1_BOMMA|nr:uncharacterized protein LOC114247523 [Bombyx mandarina]
MKFEINIHIVLKSKQDKGTSTNTLSIASMITLKHRPLCEVQTTRPAYETTKGTKKKMRSLPSLLKNYAFGTRMNHADTKRNGNPRLFVSLTRITRCIGPRYQRTAADINA